MATFYLRPSADVSLTHSCSSGSTGYNLINEATADDDSTYIYKTYSSSSSGGGSTTTTSSFTASGTLDTKYRIDSAKVVVRAKRADDATSSSTVTATVGSSSTGAKTLTTSYQSFEASIDVSNLTRSGTSVTATLTLATYVKTDTKNEDGTARITQSYIQIECTELTGYTLTTSTLGTGTVDPSGTSTIYEGNDATIKICPGTGLSYSSVTDNGTDVTSSVVYVAPTPSYTFTGTVSGASYGFAYDGNTYWVSQNTGQASSAAVAQLTFNCEVAATLVLAVINYAEATYDYGIVGAVDQTLDTSYTKDSGTAWDGSDSDKNKSTEQDITISLPAGSHFVQIKYRKDSATSSNNDNFQVRIKSLTYNTTVTGYYKYTISSVSANHDVIVTFSDYGTSKFYVKVDGAWVQAKKAYIKQSGTWVEITSTPSGWSSGGKIKKE